MDRAYVLPRAPRAPASAMLRSPAPTLPLKLSDPASRAMTDLQCDPLPAVGEEAAVERVLDEMFRQGVRASLVVREHTMLGLITAEQMRGARAGRRVADVMIPVAEVPAVDWQLVEAARVHDLAELFEDSGVSHLLVLQNKSGTPATVRGLIQRDRLERQLGPRWVAHVARTLARPAGLAPGSANQ